MQKKNCAVLCEGMVAHMGRPSLNTMITAYRESGEWMLGQMFKMIDEAEDATSKEGKQLREALLMFQESWKTACRHAVRTASDSEIIKALSVVTILYHNFNKF